MAGVILVVESTTGYYHYHLREEGQPESLCGRRDMMLTAVPLSAWGYRGHLREQYCAACEAEHNKRTANEDAHDSESQDR